MAMKLPVGSAAWVAAEKENVQQLLQQEVEEITYPAQHEMEWLNEHMADIFNKSYIDVANIFKTPGKMRGKTPRTVKKRAAEARLPLSDIFSSQPLPVMSPNNKKAAQFAVANDRVNAAVEPTSKSQADSGYHGSSQVEERNQKTPEIPTRSPLRALKSPTVERKDQEDGNHTNEGSFHSAKENQTIKVNSEPQPSPKMSEAEPPTHVKKLDGHHPHFDDIGSPSDESTPDRPSMRKKSSMNFASLPAREPLKSSIGARVSRTSHVVPKSDGQRLTSRSASTAALEDESNIASSDDESNIEILGVDDSQMDVPVPNAYSKASTQRLHEKINALGKIAPARPSKSIPSAVGIPATQNHLHAQEEAGDKEEDDDWIEPLKDNSDDDVEMANDFDIRAPELIAHEERMKQFSSSPQRPPFFHAKAASTVTLASPNKNLMAPPSSPAKSISGSHPVFESTTPHGSPSRFLDGPLSASKSKLASIMKTAKGLFTSSASVSAAAKMEALAAKSREDVTSAQRMDNALNKPLPASPPKDLVQVQLPVDQVSGVTESEDTLAMRKADEQLNKAREKERQKASQQKMSPKKDDDRPLTSSSKLSRPTKPGREVSKSRPQPVPIKVGTLSQRINPTQEILQGEPKRPGLAKKTSTTSLQSASSAMTFKTSVTSQPTKPRALLAAERKREQDEREAQRKMELKKETERKRAAQQEEARRLEQEQRADAERKERERVAAERAKRQIQQQAIERKRQEAARKTDQQRIDRTANEGAPTRPPSRLGQQSVNRPLINHPLPTNPAKPAKRPIDEEATRPQAPRFGAVAQQTDTKRRRTEDEVSEQQSKPTMSGAPIRQSQMGKKPSIFGHPSYQQLPQPSHMGQFPQPPRNAPQMAQFATSKIPFAEPSAVAPTKTPLSAYQHRTIQAVKSSPQYQNGESIQLPDIPTDSEDESDDGKDAFPIPDWAAPGTLVEQLMKQEGIDGDAVFGPIAPLRMEEIFAKGNKDRLKRLRDRTSSANWALSGDGLTLEEVRADREQRERLRLQGGWQYGS